MPTAPSRPTTGARQLARLSAVAALLAFPAAASAATLPFSLSFDAAGNVAALPEGTGAGFEGVLPNTAGNQFFRRTWRSTATAGSGSHRPPAPCWAQKATRRRPPSRIPIRTRNRTPSSRRSTGSPFG